MEQLAARPFDTIFPNELTFEVMKSCSPFDLLQLRSVSHYFFEILEKNSYFWKDFLRRWDHELPLLSHEADSNPEIWSYISYIQLIYGGGPCENCNTWTNNPPVSLALRIKTCSRRCDNEVYNREHLIKYPRGWDRAANIIDIPHQRHNNFIYYRKSDHTLHFEQHQDVLLNPDLVGNLDALRDALYARQKKNELLIMLDEELSYWRPKYLLAKEAQARKNMAFLSAVAFVERIKYGALIRTPTACRVLRAFNRDLETVTIPVWRTIRLTVLQEAKAIARNQQSESKKTCPLCNKRILNVEDHMATKHRKAIIPNTIKRACHLCHETRRKLFTSGGLAQHIVDVHRT